MTAPAPVVAPAPAPRPAGVREERVKMTPLRKRVAERLLSAQNNAAILTTFNEVDMQAVIALRKRYADRFQQRHGVKLGFMSFFVRAAVDALKAFPLVNSSIEGDEVVLKHYYDIGVAVSGSRGLVVPVLRDADTLSMAEIEKQVAELGQKARSDKLTLAELQGGTFSISNGGIFGSMLSTPILNPPQTGILGMHNIVDRPVVRDGQIVVRPVMYLALSYDHRLIDGREAVQFLVRIKEYLEDPERLLLDV
jgi:2-oxoglutarate dehydrogenase E2 component (dihydrolipoamide succinyltransferase)